MKRTTHAVSMGILTLLRREARDSKAAIWSDVAEKLSAPASRRRLVNLQRISRLTKKGDIVLVPGKVLGGGFVSHGIVVGAYSFTPAAKEKISKAGGKALNLPEFVKKYRDGEGVILVG